MNRLGGRREALANMTSRIGLQMIVKFNKKFLKLPMPVVIWTGVLVGLNVMGPLFFLGHREAWVVLIVFLVSAVMLMILAEFAGFNRLMGAAHFLWIPLLVYLWARMGAYPIVEPFGAWMRLVMLFNAASLVIDVVDITRYVRGERDELV